MTRYYFDHDHRYLTWGWSKTSDASAINLPASSWWISASQRYNESLSLMFSVKRQNAYPTTRNGAADYLYGLRATLDFF